MAHAWVQMFDSQYEAFKTYCQIYPHNAVLLVDTYNTLKSGIPDAIRAFNEVLKPLGIKNAGSGWIPATWPISPEKPGRCWTRRAGPNADLGIQFSGRIPDSGPAFAGCKIDLFGVGERMITARSEPVFGGVYKLVAVEDQQGNIIPKIKISENVGKITNPHFKKTYRLFNRCTGKAIADYICVHDEVVDESQPLLLFDPNATWKKKTVSNFEARPLQVPVF